MKVANKINQCAYSQKKSSVRTCNPKIIYHCIFLKNDSPEALAVYKLIYGWDNDRLLFNLYLPGLYF